MSAFLEKYGIAIFTIVVIGIMVLMASPLGLKVEDLVENEIQKFADTAGTESWENSNKKDKPKANEYGFYFDKIYVGKWNSDGTRDCFIFKEDGTVYKYLEINKSSYEYWCYEFDLDPDSSNLEEVAKSLNKSWYGSEEGEVFTATYDYLYADINNWSPVYFSDNGKTIYTDEDFIYYLAQLLEETPSYMMFTGIEFNSIIDEDTTSIKFVSSAARTDIDTIDVSGLGDGSVLAWYEDTTLYVAPKVADKTIYANPDCSSMFRCADYVGSDGIEPEFYINNIELTNFNTSQVTDMYEMFKGFGCDSNTATISGLENLDTANVTNMGWMFTGAFSGMDELNLDLSNWNVSSVKDFSLMFYMMYANYNADFSNWDTSSAKNMNGMFYDSGVYGFTGVENWNTSNVVDMNGMFSSCGGASFDVDLSTKTVTVNGKTYTAWEVSNVKNMGNMFAYINSTYFNPGDISNWDISNVTSMYGMFDRTARSADYTLDLRDWKNKMNPSVSTNYFQSYVEDKIIAPWE